MRQGGGEKNLALWVVVALATEVLGCMASSGDEEGEGHGHGEGHEDICGEDQTIFSCHVVTLSIFVTVVVVFSSLFEFARHMLDHWLLKRKYLRHVVDHIYKELSTLGLLSFLLFAVEQGRFVHLSEEKEELYKELFEFVHFLLFVLVVMFIVLVIMLLVFTNYMSKKWITYQSWDLVEVEQRLPDRIAQRDLLRGTSPEWLKYLTSSAYRRKCSEVRGMRKCVEMHSLRWQFVSFLESNANPRTGESYTTADTLLAPDGGFDFAEYLRGSVFEVAVELAELSWTFWLPVLGLVWLNVLRYEFMNLTPSEAVVILIMIESACLLLVIYLHHRESRTRREVMDSVDIAARAHDVANNSTAGPSDNDSAIGNLIGPGSDRLTMHRERFLLRRPIFHLRIFQVVTLFQSLYTLGLIYYFKFLAYKFLLVFLILPLPFTLYLGTRILRYHAINASLGPFTRWSVVSEMRDVADRDRDRRRREGDVN